MYSISLWCVGTRGVRCTLTLWLSYSAGVLAWCHCHWPVCACTRVCCGAAEYLHLCICMRGVLLGAAAVKNPSKVRGGGGVNPNPLCVVEGEGAFVAGCLSFACGGSDCGP